MTKLRSLATADMLANDGAFPQSVLEDSSLLAALYPDKAEFSRYEGDDWKQLIVVDICSIGRPRYRNDPVVERRHHANSAPVELAEVG